MKLCQPYLPEKIAHALLVTYSLVRYSADILIFKSQEGSIKALNFVMSYIIIAP